MKALKEYYFVSLFERFIRDSYTGKRLKADGRCIKRQTVDNYVYVLHYLKEYEAVLGHDLLIKVLVSRNRKLLIAESNYWKKFYLGFTDFLYSNKDCYDNYVGNVIKIIRSFFSYLNKDLAIVTCQFYKKFYVCKEEIPIVTLLPDQLQFLIQNNEFQTTLNKSLQTAKDIFVFGCTVGLRVSDIFAIKVTDIEYVGDFCYLPVQTIKTNSQIRVKLPNYAVAIINKYKKGKRGRVKLFPKIPVVQFNKQIKMIAEKADWTYLIGKTRSKRGILYDRINESVGKPYRFCDLLSSHTMRRTAITTMLMLGMKEYVVKRISGHSDNSRSFGRYVNLRLGSWHTKQDIFAVSGHRRMVSNLPSNKIKLFISLQKTSFFIKKWIN